MSAVAMTSQGGAGKHDVLEGEFLGLTHSPPQFTPSSYEMSHHKVSPPRARTRCGVVRVVCDPSERGILVGHGARTLS